jgi:hypothetical protein
MSAYKTHVGDVTRSAAEEHQILRFERCACWELGSGVELVLGHSGQGDPRHLVGGLDEAGAVEADPRGLAAPDIRRADLGEGPVDGDPTGCAGGNGLCLGLAVGVGEGDDLRPFKRAIGAR